MNRQAPWPPLRHLASVSVALRVVAVIVLPLIAGAAYYEIRAARTSIITETERQMSRLDMVFAEQTGRAAEAVDLLVLGAAETIESSPPDGLAELFRRRIRGVRQLSGIVAFDRSGRETVTTDTALAAIPAAIIRQLLERYGSDSPPGLLVSAPFRGQDGRWSALLTRPIHGPDGRFAGMVAGSINLAYFEDFYRSVELNENGAIILHLRDGTVLARFPHVDQVIGTSFGHLPPFTEVLAHAQAGTLLMESPVDGSIRVTAIRALKAYPLVVMVSVEQGRILEDWRHGAYTLIGVSTILGCAVVILLLSLSRRSRLVEQLLHQTHGAREMAEQAHDGLLQQIAEREKAEVALRQAQRIEAIGQLTGGVAHDFNNLLMVVLGNVDILQRQASDAHAVSRLASIRTAAERGATLTSHLLAFAGRQSLMPKAVDLNETIQGMGDLLDSALNMRVHVKLNLAHDLWPAMVDRSQIELLILNLVINARDAMPEGGLITIETTNHRRTDTAANGALPGDYVSVAVHDMGEGIDPAILPRVFEPFFTTKGPGMGSGLGLSQVFGTAKQSGGDVRIVSSLGRGTTVTVDLPRAATVVLPAFGVDKRPQSGVGILLVDDDDPVRAVTVGMLRELGYDVRDAASGKAALDLLQQDEGIDLLLTDLVMPTMNGVQLAAMARASRPDLPVVFISGHANSIGESMVLDGQLLRKPFDVDDLSRVLEDALTERQAALSGA